MDRIPLFPLSRGLFPDGLLGLQIFEVRYLDMVKRALKEKTPFGVVQLEAGAEVAKPGESPSFSRLGCLAHIVWADAPQPALFLLRCRGGQRFELSDPRCEKYGLWTAAVSLIPDDLPTEIPQDLQLAANQLGRVIRELQQQGLSAEEMPILAPYKLDEAGWVANRWSEILPLSSGQRLAQLEERDPLARLERVVEWLGAVG